jgi:hypothetical protein
MSIDAKVSHVRREVRKGQTRDHECHAKGCSRQVPPALLMCARHWKMVPRNIQKAIWTHYQTGQEKGESRPTPEYMQAFKAAVDAVAQVESKQGALPL